MPNANATTPVPMYFGANGANVVLVKYTFAGALRFPDVIRNGLPQEPRELDHIEDAIHARNAKKIGEEELGTVGRHREGRVDTGEYAWHNEQKVQTRDLRSGLTNAGYRMKRAYWYEREPQGTAAKKFVAVMAFVRNDSGDERVVELTRGVERALQRLGTTVWMFAHAFVNPPRPDGMRVDTINLVNSLDFDEKTDESRTPAERKLAVQDRQLACIEL